MADGLPWCADTGADTPTGGRIKLVEERLDGEPFCATYADGVADIDLALLLGAHRGSGAVGTVTVVRPTLQFGVAELDEDGRVLGFEKPCMDRWINGGFFRFEPVSLPTWRRTACSSASPSSAWPPTVSSTPSDTWASGTAWTPTRTRFCSTTCGPQASRRGASGPRSP